MGKLRADGLIRPKRDKYIAAAVNIGKGGDLHEIDRCTGFG
ncbi:hypothetical protein LY28_03167 [Ruminiclostridium sufflavum DSM 19573]|uniref:Uncharacterized protein n=1 Tax=Ruminiclostridium sufflavum DSM 19573 TaxID=1121337 RepID=A0A318XJ60_9FIRM|nr:hypothetical protein [Ruminiclostridium sufflavum]PYG85748.1 hypothetical protein LY28_03167 [Ruminiclostridium sufflavum DSM 19573]